MAGPVRRRLPPREWPAGHLELARWRDLLFGQTGRRAGFAEALYQFRAGGRVETQAGGGQLGDLCVDDGRVAAESAGPAGSTEGDRSPGPGSGLQGTVRAVGEESRLVHLPWGCVSGRREREDETVPPGGAQRQTQFPHAGAFPGGGPVEPLLRAGHQRGGPLVGQRRGGLGGNRLRAA